MPTVYSKQIKKKFQAGDNCECFDNGNCKYKKEVEKINNSINLYDKKFLLVGGRKNIIDCCKQIVSANGGFFEHHDGGMENSKKRLSNAAVKADIIICALDCVSHGACRSMKKICKKENKNIIYLRDAEFKNFSERFKKTS